MKVKNEKKKRIQKLERVIIWLTIEIQQEKKKCVCVQIKKKKNKQGERVESAKWKGVIRTCEK